MLHVATLDLGYIDLESSEPIIGPRPRPLVADYIASYCKHRYVAIARLEHRLQHHCISIQGLQYACKLTCTLCSLQCPTYMYKINVGYIDLQAA